MRQPTPGLSDDWSVRWLRLIFLLPFSTAIGWNVLQDGGDADTGTGTGGRPSLLATLEPCSTPAPGLVPTSDGFVHDEASGGLGFCASGARVGEGCTTEPKYPPLPK